MKRNALVILERPWGYGDEDQNVVSVLPYFQGLERSHGGFDLYHSNFYEANSFKLALDELTKMDYQHYYVYVACHGSGKRLGKMNLSTVLAEINAKGQDRNITGVILGSCLVGKNTNDMQVYTESSSISWKIGYKCSVDWLEGTLLDLKLFHHLMGMDKRHLAKSKHIVNRVNQALATYNPNASIGEDEKKQDMPLDESLTLVIQPTGKGNRAGDYSDCLFATIDE